MLWGVECSLAWILIATHALISYTYERSSSAFLLVAAESVYFTLGLRTRILIARFWLSSSAKKYNSLFGSITIIRYVNRILVHNPNFLSKIYAYTINSAWDRVWLRRSCYIDLRIYSDSLSHSYFLLIRNLNLLCLYDYKYCETAPLENSTPDRASSWIWPQHRRFIWIFCLEWKAAGNSVIAPFPEIFGPHIHVRTRQFTTSKRHLNFCNAGASFPTSLSAVIRRCKNVITIINLASEKVSAQLAPAVSLTSTARPPLVLLFPPLLRGDASSPQPSGFTELQSRFLGKLYWVFYTTKKSKPH